MKRFADRLPDQGQQPRPMPTSLARGAFILAMSFMAFALPAETLAQSRPVTPTRLSGQVRLDTTPMFTIQETKRQYVPSAKDGTFQKETPKSGHGVVGLDMLVHPDRYPVIQAVFRGTPAQKAGMLPGDTIVSVNGTQAIGKSLKQVDLMISDRPGDAVQFIILRDGELKPFKLTVAAIEDVSAAAKREFSSMFGGGY